MRAPGIISCCRGSAVSKATLQTFIHSYTQPGFLSLSFSLSFFKTCLLNISRFYSFITDAAIVRVSEEFSVLGLL